MISYLTGMIFIFFYIILMYLIGLSVTNNQKSFPYSFVIGYLIYSFFVAVFGIPIQMLNLKWKYFEYCLIAVIVGLVFFAVYKIRKNRIHVDIKSFFSEQWFNILIAFILVFAATWSVKDNWFCNNLDDGFYMGIAAAQPEALNGFNTNPATGFEVSSLGSYLFNTIYTEYSVFSRVFSINPLILCHLYFAFFDYYLLCSVIHVLAEYIFEGKGLKETTFQYFSIVTLIFAVPQTYLRDNSLLWVQDSWQFNTAMFYGSSIVRTMGSLLLVLPFIRHKKMTLKDILLAGGISVVLMSKSSIALPVIVITCISYVLTTWIIEGNKKDRVLSLLFMLCLILGGFVLGNNDEIQNTVYTQIVFAKDAYFSFFSCIGLFLFSLFYKNRNIYKINLLIVLMICMLLVNPLNNIFEISSMYPFVAARTLAMLIYLNVILSFMYLVYGVYKCVHLVKLRKAIMCGMVICIVYVFAFCNYRYNGLSGLYLQYKNPYYIPQSTVELGELLEERYSETGDINYVMMPERVCPFGIHHPVAIILRTVSPNSVSLAGALRYGDPEIGVLDGYTNEYLSYYYDFTGNPTAETYLAYKNMADKYPINVIITLNRDAEEYLLSDGYSLYGAVTETSDGIDYFVYSK